MDRRREGSSGKLVLLWGQNSTSNTSHLRIELMEAIPKTIQSQCKKYGVFDSVGIIVRVVREVMPAEDFSRLSMASD
eukprot:11399516-Prorocentrum_lima.AAC.1